MGDYMKNIKVVALPVVLIFIATSLLSGCTGLVVSEKSPTESATSEVQSASESKSAQSQDTSSTKNNSLIKHHSTEHTYKHGKDGYYNLLENGVEFELTSQLSGTCWICASACAMMTSYQLNHDGKIELDQMELLNEIYSDDKKEGVVAVNGSDKDDIGGSGLFVVNELANGFGDGLILDHAISAQNWSMDEVKEGIKKYGDEKNNLFGEEENDNNINSNSNSYDNDNSDSFNKIKDLKNKIIENENKNNDLDNKLNKSIEEKFCDSFNKLLEEGCFMDLSRKIKWSDIDFENKPYNIWDVNSIDDNIIESDNES